MNRLLIVQQEGETLHEELAAAGYVIAHHSDDPLPWMQEDMANLLSFDQVLVSINAFAPNSPAIGAVSELVTDEFDCFLYVGPEEWLSLSSEKEEGPCPST